MKYVSSPNLPENPVKYVLISEAADAGVISDLEKSGINALRVKPCGDILPSVSSHADMLFHHIGNNKLFYYKSSDVKLYNKLKGLGFELTSIRNKLSRKYPLDVPLNSAIIGNYLFCRKDSTAKELMNFYSDKGVHIINIKQGYSKCSICVVDENSIITSDSGIAAAAEKCGMDVLKIRVGYIALKGCGYGFIGGCCGKLSKDIIAFCGDVTKHPDFPAMYNFIGRHSVSVKILGQNTCLNDVGGIIPLIEYQ